MPMTKIYYIEGLTRKELFLDDILIAGAASIMTKTMLAPFERIHLTMVNQSELLKNGSNALEKQFKSKFDCGIQLFKQEGLRTFWRGNLASCIAHFPSPTLNLTFKDELKISFDSKNEDPLVSKLPKNMAAGGIAGLITLCFIYPFDLARSRLAFDIKTYKNSSQRQYDGLMDVLKKTVRQENGFLGLYKGFYLTSISTIIYRSLYFGLYDSMKPKWLGESPSMGYSFFVGYGVSLLAGFLSYPVDTVKRRMALEPHSYKSSWDCFHKIFKKEGYRAVMNGSSSHYLRAFDGALFLMGFDELVYLIMEKYNEKKKKI